MTEPLTLTLPPVGYVVPGADPEHLTDEQDKAYNAHCTGLVKDFIAEHGPVVKTHYPFDAPDGSTDDTVTLDDDGNVVVLDRGEA